MNKVIILNNENMGQGDDELGYKLTGAFLKKIWAKKDKPAAIIFYNSGVKLLASSSSYLDALHGLYDSGVDLVACGTCIDTYNLRDEIKVGRISGMEEIVNLMMNADDTITI